MKKINFQNNITKVNKATFDEFQNNIEESCVAVSPTQPETNERVWIQKGKNLLSKIISGYEITNSASGNINANNDWFVTDFIPVESGKPYYAQGISNYSKWWFDKDKNFISFTIDNPGTAPSNAKYIRLNGEISASSNMMVFQGTEATEYEAYVEKKIKTKNSNGEFETIYDENDLLKTQVYERSFGNVGNTGETGIDVDFATMFPNLSLDNIVCFNVEIVDVFTTWDRVYANILKDNKRNGILQIRSYSVTQPVAVRVTAFYK